MADPAAAARRPPRAWPYHLVFAVIALIGLSFCALFPYALYANAVAMVDGYRASHGSAGTPGTVTLVARSGVKSRTVCRGDFVPAAGSPTMRVRVELPGTCETGQRHPARLTAPPASLFTGYDEPRAWVAGSDDWREYILLVVLFSVLTFGPLAVFGRLVGKGLRTSRR